MEKEKFDIQEVPEIKKGGSIIFSIILATGLAAGCALRPQTKTSETYTTPKNQQIKTERRPLYLCSASKKDLSSLESQCVANVKKYKEDGLNCLSCDSEVDVLK